MISDEPPSSAICSPDADCGRPATRERADDAADELADDVAGRFAGTHRASGEHANRDSVSGVLAPCHSYE
jgi:hypothetical protein